MFTLYQTVRQNVPKTDSVRSEQEQVLGLCCRIIYIFYKRSRAFLLHSRNFSKFDVPTLKRRPKFH